MAALLLPRLLGAVGGIFRLLPLWAWAVVLALAWGSWQRQQSARATAAAESARAAQALSTAAQQAEAALREQEHQFATNARKAADVYARTNARAQAAAASSAAGLDRLRHALAAAPVCTAASGAATAGAPDVAAPLRQVLGECGTALQAMGADAQAEAARLSALQDYVRATRPPVDVGRPLTPEAQQ